MLLSLVSEYSAYLQAEKGLAAATQRGYLATVEGLLALCRAHPRRLHLPPEWGPEHLDKRALEIYLNHLREERGLAPGTLALRASALRSFFGFLQSRGHLERNPARSLLPRLPPRAEAPPDGDEAAVQALLATPGTGLTTARLALLVELGYGAGLRPAAIYGVRALRILGRSGSVRIEGAGEPVDAPLSPAGLERVRRYLALRKRVVGARRPAPFWVDERGRACSPERLARQLKRAMEGAGLPGRPALLRQLAARHFAARGGDTRSVQRLLHARRLGSLDRYAPPEFKAIAAQFRRIHPRQQKKG